MDVSAFELSEEINNRTVKFPLTPSLWKKFNFTDFENISWSEMKYLDDNNSEINSEVENIPNDKGGIYLFIIKPDNNLDTICEFLVYVGRAKCTTHQNLRKRCKEYFAHYTNGKERPKIFKMFRYWGENLYYRYYPMTDNTLITKLEDGLINSLLPPFNKDIPNKKTRDAVNAFS